MAKLTAKQAYDSLTAYIHKKGGSYSAWYAGVTGHLKQRVTDEHKVVEKTGTYNFEECVSDPAARTAEKWLLALGCDGDTGGGKDAVTHVYVYLKNPSTNP